MFFGELILNIINRYDSKHNFKGYVYIINTVNDMVLSLQKEWGAATCVPIGSEEPKLSEAYKQRDSEDKKKQREKIKGMTRK